MKYVMKSGTLSDCEKALIRVKGDFIGPGKKLYYADGTVALQTDIRKRETGHDKTGDVRFRYYVMLDVWGNEVAVGKPDYEEGEDPISAGWPVCRMPKTAHMQLLFREREYCLRVVDSQNYTLKEPSGKIVLHISHRGLSGGWDIEADDLFPPEVVCGIFVFCRYLEQENEFIIV